jgi:hypothetical protein
MRTFLVGLLLMTQWGWSQPLEISPTEGETVTEDRPCVQVSWPKGSLQRGQSRLWFNGKEVTSECLRNDDFLSFRPYKSPAEGKTEVRFSSLNASGQPVEKSWSFLLSPASCVQSVEHNGGIDLLQDDVLEVRLRARPKGKASFVAGPVGPIAMIESESGLYVGTHKIRSSDCALGADVVVTLQVGDHRETAKCAKPVKLFGGLYRVKVFSPADGSSVDQSFVITGRARPGSRVNAIAKLGMDSDTLAPTTDSTQVTGTAGSIPAEVDAEGNFTLEYGLPIHISGMRVVMSIFAVEEDGTRSVPTVVRYRFK